MQIHSKKQLSLIIALSVGATVAVACGAQTLRLDIAQRFYDWGVKYKAIGWPAGSREAFNCAAVFGQGSPIATAARRYRDTKLPRHPVTGEAIQINIEGYNADHYGNRAAARIIFLNCISRYPDFEWPYNNLFSLCLSEGKFAEAEKYGLQALALNPQYVNALVNMSISKYRQNDLVSARTYLNRALEADPTDAGAVQMNTSLTSEEEKMKEQAPKAQYLGQ